MKVDGFRGLNAISVDFPFPIMAISGANGSGKTTLMHLAGCAFGSDGQSAFSPYLKTYFPVSVADPYPFRDDCKVEYKFVEHGAGEGGRQRRLTLSRRDDARWEGYKRRAKRSVVYLGMSYFLPKFEKTDLSIYSAGTLRLEGESILPREVTSAISSILKTNYDNSFEYSVGTSRKSINLVGLERKGTKYSENNMGFGEARVAYLVRHIEKSPPGTLFLLEEPEISLHGDAQRRLIRYLIEACFNFDHQVIMTTHSRDILAELPSSALVYLQRGIKGNTEVLPAIGAYEASGLLGNSAEVKRVVLVEDSVAEALVKGSLRKFNRTPFLRTMSIVQGGDRASIERLATSLRKIDHTRVTIVLDGDMRSNSSSASPASSGNDFSTSGSEVSLFLPGELPPEKEIVQCQSVVKGMSDLYAVDISNTVAATPDHHNYFREIAYSVSEEEVSVLDRAVELYWNEFEEKAKDLALNIVSSFD